MDGSLVNSFLIDTKLSDSHLYQLSMYITIYIYLIYVSIYFYIIKIYIQLKIHNVSLPVVHLIHVTTEMIKSLQYIYNKDPISYIIM